MYVCVSRFFLIFVLPKAEGRKWPSDDDDDDDMHLERMVAREEKWLACWLLLAAVEAGISKLCILKVKETLVRS